MMTRPKATGKKVTLAIEGWVNIYQDSNGRIYHTTILYETEALARKQAGTGHQDTVHLSQEFSVSTTKAETIEEEPVIETLKEVE